MSPQQKKQLSYERDRRNTYGENHAASLKGIRKRKRTIARAGRRASHQMLGTIRDGEDAAEDAHADLSFQAPPEWTKSADQPLGRVLAQRTVRELETAVALYASAIPSLVTSLIESLPDDQFTATDCSDLAARFARDVDAHARPRVALSLSQAQTALRIIRRILAGHGIEPRARRNRKTPPRQLS